MDVNQSSLLQSPSQLTKILYETVDWMNELSSLNPGHISFIHRRGDEILLVARGFATAYLIAFYIRTTWAFSHQFPYFGIGYGDLSTEFPDHGQLETWNSPIMKQARRCMDQLKSHKSSARQFAMFNEEDNRYCTINQLLNEYAEVQDRFFKLQTDPDRLASAMYSLNHLQEWIASTLNKNRSTISRQLHKANIDLILTMKNRILRVLGNLEQTFEARLTDTEILMNGNLPHQNRDTLESQIKNILTLRADSIREHMLTSDKI